MLTRNEILKLKSLHNPKGRKSNKSVLIEGLRLVEEGLKSKWTINNFFITSSCFEKDQFQTVINLVQSIGIIPKIISEKDMYRICTTKNPQGIAIEIQLPKTTLKDKLKDKIIYLDNISDPGNLGTIMRTAVWFGVDQIILSQNCTSPWNSKVLRSAMGAHFKIDIKVMNISDIISNNKTLTHRVIGAVMDGNPLFDLNNKLSTWILVLGNEGQGINPENLKLLHHKITIKGTGNQESLNVAVASGIILNYLFNLD